MQNFTIPLGTAPAYAGQVDAVLFEGGPPVDTSTPLNHIRTTQPWGAHAEWTVTGAFVPFLIDEFHVQLHVESIGPGPDFLFGPVKVMTTAGTNTGPNQKSYKADVVVPAGTVPPGVYKAACLVQLHDDATPGNAYPIVSCIELPILTIFQPA